jgi:predicted MFS family arabinose efflux permease
MLQVMPGHPFDELDELGEAAVEESDEALLEGDTRFPPGTARSALAHREFRTLFLGAWASNIGTWMQQVVLAAYAYDLTGSSTFVGQLVFAQLGPVLFLGLVGGVVADLVDRKKLLLGITVAQMAAATALAAVVAADEPSRGVIFLTALGSGICASLFMPAYSAMLPSLVGRGDLPGAISLNSTQMNASRVVGPAIGGVAFATVGPAWVFLANAASYLFVVGALLRVHLPTVPTGEPEPIGRKLTGGIRAARRDRVVGRALVTISVFSFFSIVYVGMMPVLAAENLGIDEDSVAYGFFYACFGFGAVVGSIANGTVLHGVHKPLLVRLGLVAYAVVVSVLAVLRSAPPSFVVVMLVGATYFGMVTALNTVMQSRLVDHERGRVMALWMMGFGGTVSLANLAFGPVVDRIGMTPVMLGGAVVALVLSRYADLDVRSPASPPAPALAD